MNLLKSTDYLDVKKLVSLSAVVSILLASIIIGTASAAGSAQITMESVSSGEAGSQQEIRLYVTPSGAALYTVQTTVNLSNMTFVGYTPNGSYFAGANQVYSGGSVGSTQFTIGASHQGLAETAPGVKAFVGTIRTQLGGSAGTATASQTGAKADDAIDVSPMSVTAPSRAITITAAQAPTCPAGQIGTPPNCSTPTPSGGTGSSSGGTAPVNPVTSPNPNSSAVVPTTEGTPEAPSAEVVSEDQLSLLLTDSEQTQPVTTVATTTKSSSLPIALSVGGLFTLVLAGVGAKVILGRMNSARELSAHTNGFSSSFGGSTTSTPDVKPSTTEITPSNSTNPTVTQPANQDGPVVISPDKKG